MILQNGGCCWQMVVFRTVVVSPGLTAFDNYCFFSVVCLVFDLSDWKSLEHVSNWFSDAENANPGDFITFLIGTKSDLVVVSVTSFVADSFRHCL